MNTNIRTNFKPIAIGSFPYRTPGKALEKIFEYYREIPLWPQLPRKSALEQMYIQYTENMPGINYNSETGKLTAREPDDEFFIEMGDMLEKAMAEEVEPFAISASRASGFHEFLSQEKKIKDLKPDFVKGHVTGPISFGLNVTDINMKPLLYDDSYKEIITQTLTMKALWQGYRLANPGFKTIIFVDEPYLANIGSSMVAISETEATNILSEMITILKKKGFITGVHCCGNTDWAILFNSGCTIISADIYEYGDNFLLYADEIVRFINNGGIIAWGMVPTSPEAEEVTMENLESRLEKYLNKLAEKGLNRKTLLNQSLVSGSCGMGNLSPQLAETVMKKNRLFSDYIRNKYNFNS
ncbi:MAG: hypothetical protein ACLFQV_10515 [Vulcanimicrobiota bacterium]